MAIKQSPLITQYLSVKASVPDAILFFRLGDFYEMFFEDAETGARILEIQLTSRSKDGVPLCGVPYHSAEPYIAKLLKAGLKVAICEQAAPAHATGGSSGKGGAFQSATPAGTRMAPGRGLMARQVVRVITPGTVGEEMVLVAGEKNFLLAATPAGDGFALAAIDISTGEFIATHIATVAALKEEIARIAPREIIAPGGAAGIGTIAADLRCPMSEIDAAQFDPAAARAAIAARFGDSTGAAQEDGTRGAASAAATGGDTSTDLVLEDAADGGAIDDYDGDRALDDYDGDREIGRAHV